MVNDNWHSVMEAKTEMKGTSTLPWFAKLQCYLRSLMYKLPKSDKHVFGTNILNLMISTTFWVLHILRSLKQTAESNNKKNMHVMKTNIAQPWKIEKNTILKERCKFMVIQRIKDNMLELKWQTIPFKAVSKIMWADKWHASWNELSGK